MNSIEDIGSRLGAARFISPREIGGLDDGAPLLFTETTVGDGLRAARLSITALGVYVARINGHRVGDEHLAPGWTAYQHRLLVQAHHVTALVSAGPLRLEVLLGNGWYRGQLVWPGNRASYGDRLALLAELELDFADGRRQLIGTDGSWSAMPSAVLHDDLYDGETRDGAWRAVDAPLSGVDEMTVDARLEIASAPPVRATGTLPAQRMWRAPSGATLVDFGQNAVGRVRLRLHDDSEEVVVRHAEVLENGELGVRPLRSAKATCRYLSVDAGAVLEPELTFSGFRYAEISGIVNPALGDVELVILGSDLERTGWFDCSDPELNRLHENVVWSARGNFLSIPTDCPQRDERLGWTGDIQVFAPSAAYLFDTRAFLSEWLRDLALEQHADGSVPFVIPDVIRQGIRPEPPAAAAWGDAAVVVPHVLHRAYGDDAILRDQYASMVAWVEKVRGLAGESLLWSTGFQFGDWLDPSAPPDDPAAARADPAVVATACFIRCIDLLADTARVLGHGSDAAEYAELAALARIAFADAYVDDVGIVRSDCQTVYAIAIVWGLLPSAVVDRAGARLVRLVEEADFAIDTGFVGTAVILDALTAAGRTDVAYAMLQRRECPSWLYPVTMGATTIWERWDSMLPDGSINPGSMTSFNHYAYGAVSDWMHRVIGGLEPLEPGYRTFRVRPRPGGTLTWARVAHRSPLGMIEVSWRLTGDRLHLRVVVPDGARAVLDLDGSAAEHLDAGAHEREVEMPAA